MAKNDDGPFVAVYYSDGTYDAYRKYRGRQPGDPEGISNEPAYGYVFEEEPIKGSWDSSDGFFDLSKDGKRSYIGTIQFEGPVPGGLAPSGWEGCHKAPEPVHHPDGSWSQSGPPMFRGLSYSGKPGGRITTS